MPVAARSVSPSLPLKVQALPGSGFLLQQRFQRVAPLAVVLSLLAACSTGASAVRTTLSGVVFENDPTANVALNSKLFYERVTLGGHPALLVLGFEDGPAAGKTEVWYSHEREVLRLQGGRLIGTAGMTLNWTAVSFPDGVPAWPTGDTETSAVFRRRHSAEPGHLTDLDETLQLTSIAPPSNSGLKDLDPAKLRWVEERVLTGVGRALPPARYGLSRALPSRVVYGEQCLAGAFCLTWQRWPVTGAVPE